MVMDGLMPETLSLPMERSEKIGMGITMEIIQTETILMHSPMIQINGQTLMVTDMATVQFLAAEISSLVIQRNGAILMEMVSETIPMVTMVTSARNCMGNQQYPQQEDVLTRTMMA